MNLKEYIKNINEFLLTEEFDEGDSTTMNNKVAALQDLLKRFQEFLQKIKGKTTLEEIQAAAKNGQSTPANNTQQQSAENQQAAKAAAGAPAPQPPADSKEPTPAPTA